MIGRALECLGGGGDVGHVNLVKVSPRTCTLETVLVNLTFQYGLCGILLKT